MLLIRRKQGESILIGDQVELTILDLSAHRVTVGIQAPAAVAIVRKEILPVMEQNRAAARTPVPGSLQSLRSVSIAKTSPML